MEPTVYAALGVLLGVTATFLTGRLRRRRRNAVATTLETEGEKPELTIFEEPTVDVPSSLQWAPRPLDSADAKAKMDSIVRAFARNVMKTGPEQNSLAEQMDRMAAVLRYVRFGTDKIGRLDLTIEEFAQGIRNVATELKQTHIIPGLPIKLDLSNLNLETLQGLQSIAYGVSKDVTPKMDVIVAITASIAATPTAIIGALFWFGLKHLGLDRVKRGLAVYAMGKLLVMFYLGVTVDGADSELVPVIRDNNLHRKMLWEVSIADDLLLLAGKDDRLNILRLCHEDGRVTSEPRFSVPESNDVNCARVSPERDLVMWGTDDNHVAAAELGSSSVPATVWRSKKLYNWVMDLAPFWKERIVFAVSDLSRLFSFKWRTTSVDGLVWEEPREEHVYGRGQSGVPKPEPSLPGSRCRLSSAPDANYLLIWTERQPLAAVYVLRLQRSADDISVVPYRQFNTPDGVLAVAFGQHDLFYFLLADGSRRLYNPHGQELEKVAFGDGGVRAAAFMQSNPSVCALAMEPSAGLSPSVRIYAGEVPFLSFRLEQGDLVTSIFLSEERRLVIGLKSGHFAVYDLGSLPHAE